MPLSLVCRALLVSPLLAFFAITAGCSSSPEEDESEEAISLDQANAALEISPLDIWAQTFPQSEVQLTVTRNGRRVQAAEYPVAKVYLRDAGRYEIRLSAPLHEPAQVALDYDGSGSLSGITLASVSPEGTGISLGRTQRAEGGRNLTAHGLFLGLRHKWFSAQGRPARRGNKVALLMDGQEAWSNVRQELVSAKQNVHVATWWWESGFEMVRDLDPSRSVAERWPNTIMGTLEAIPATKRVIVGQFWGQDSILSWLNTDSKLRAFANTPNDKFEFMGQANETKGSFDWSVPTFRFGDRVRAARTDARALQFVNEAPVRSTVPGRHVDLSAGAPILQDFANGLLETASFHQKFMVIDSKTAFVGGMNLRQNDWDSSGHQVYDPRRMKPDATMMQRMDVAGALRLTDDAPRKDYMVRIDGPSAQDVDDVFRTRWQHLRNQQVRYSQNTSSYELKRDIPAAGATQLQVTATLPEPFNEHAIAETWFNAVRSATKYIYIEDQYFRIPMLDEAIAKRMQEVPDLKLIVITSDVGRNDPGCSQSRLAYGMYRQKFPDRSFFYQLRTFDSSGDPANAFQAIDTHSKMLIVDDTFMSVGSANKNNRGIVYEGELNVAIADPAFVADARKRIIWNLLGSNGTPGTVPADWHSALAAQVAANDQGFRTWSANKASAKSVRPVGFVYPLVYQRLDDCLLASVGPDRT